MTGIAHAQYSFYERLFGKRFQELILSSTVWFGYALMNPGTGARVKYAVSWIALSLLTGIAYHIGSLTREECRDLRFMWLSIHGKLPRLLLWIFWPIVVLVLLRPAFGIPALIATGLSFFRGYHFRRACMGYRAVTLADFAVRTVSGFLLA